VHIIILLLIKLLLIEFLLICLRLIQVLGVSIDQRLLFVDQLLSLLNLLIHVSILGDLSLVIRVLQQMVHVSFRNQFPVHNCHLLLLDHNLLPVVFLLMLLDELLFLEEVLRMVDLMLSLPYFSVVSVVVLCLFSLPPRRVSSFLLLGFAQLNFTFNDLHVIFDTSLQPLLLHECVEYGVFRV